MPHNSEHSQYTGRSTGQKARVARGNILENARKARAERIKGLTLAFTSNQTLFAEDGQSGIWDLLEASFGARNIPKLRVIPWTIVVRNGVLVAVHADGRIKASSTTAAVTDLEAVESKLQTVLGAAWTNAGQASTVAKTADSSQISYGTMGPRAIDRLQCPTL